MIYDAWVVLVMVQVGVDVTVVVSVLVISDSLASPDFVAREQTAPRTLCERAQSDSPLAY